MKNYLILIPALLFFLLPCLPQAQTVGTIGLKGGPTFSKFKVDFEGFPTVETGNMTGMNAEIFVELFYKQFFTLNTALAYTRRGGTFDLPFSPFDSTDVLSDEPGAMPRDYLMLKPLLKFHVPIGIVKPYVMGGPAVSFLVKDQNYPQSANEGLKNAIFGIQYGAGVELNIRKIGFLAEFQSNYDLTPFYKSDSYQSKGIDRTWWLNFGMKVNLYEKRKRAQ